MLPLTKKQEEYCQFCTILQEYQARKSLPLKVLNQNDQFFAFEDHYKSAQEHILVCTKEHIESALHVKQSEQLKRMEAFGLETLKKITKREFLNPSKETKFCFHLPPHISEHHIHLHCFVLPFINKDKERRVFGYLGWEVDKVVELLNKREEIQIKMKQKVQNPQFMAKEAILGGVRAKL